MSDETYMEIVHLIQTSFYECERNWSTFSLVNSRPTNKLKMSNLYKFVYMHYNMRLKIRNLFKRQQDADYYNPIDLNYIFVIDDILDSWIHKGEELVLNGLD